MNTVSKNIRRLRKRDGISQEKLAEKLCVTRQAVSSWETGKTQPDIDTLIAIASAFDTDVNTLIYGESAVAKQTDTRKYRRLIYITAAINVVFILLAIFLVPYLRYLASCYYKAMPMWIYQIWARPIWVISAAVMFLSILSLWKDIRITNMRLKTSILWFGILMIGFYILGATDMWFNFMPLPLEIAILPAKCASNPMVFLIPGTALFFGLNK